MAEVSHPLEATQYSPQPVTVSLETDSGICRPLVAWRGYCDQRAQRLKGCADEETGALSPEAPCSRQGRGKAWVDLGSCLRPQGFHSLLLAAPGLPSCGE